MCSLIRPVMVHNFDTLRSHLMLTATYAASPGFLDGIGWQVENSGHVVVNKESSEDCVITMVGKIIDYRYFVRPQGNYSSEEFGDLSTAKYLFHLEKQVTHLLKKTLIRHCTILRRSRCKLLVRRTGSTLSRPMRKRACFGSRATYLRNALVVFLVGQS